MPGEVRHERFALSTNLSKLLELLAPRLEAEYQARIVDVLGIVLKCSEECSDSDPHFSQRTPNGSVPRPGGRLLPIGAYGLGNLLDGETVDVVYLAPPHVRITGLVQRLSKTLQQKGVSTVLPGCDDGSLRGPAIAFYMRGVRVKLIVSQQVPALPKQYADSVLIASSGFLARAAVESVLTGVPNVEQFAFLLRLVRCWARQRGIYGNFFGFLGGMAWAVCCARVCQMERCSDAFQLALTFFRIMSHWNWSEPVVLTGFDYEAPDLDEAELAEEPRKLFSVILPAGIGIPASRTVPRTTAMILVTEIFRGYKLVQQVGASQAQWPDLFKPFPFFRKYQNYLQFKFFASSEEVLEKWFIWAMDQMAEIVTLFEAESSSCDIVRPWPFAIPFNDTVWAHSRSVFIGLRLGKYWKSRNNRLVSSVTLSDGSEQSCYDFRLLIAKFLTHLDRWPRACQYESMFDLLIEHVHQEALVKWLQTQTGFWPSQ